jgi:hypothetical protein
LLRDGAQGTIGLPALRRRPSRETSMSEFHGLVMNAITGEPVNFELYKGHVCMVINVASR